jgi:16S rRNA processing protein RimM
MANPPDDLIILGRITGSYGVKGWIRIQSFDNANTSNLLKTKHWWLLPRDKEAVSANASSNYLEFKVEQARAHSGDIVAQVLTVTQPEAAKALTGAQIAVSRGVFQATNSLEYYWVDLLGCEVRNRQQVTLGRVLEVDDHGAHAFLKVQAVREKSAANSDANSDVLASAPEDILIPFVATYIDEVLLPQRLILVDWELDWQS